MSCLEQTNPFNRNWKAGDSEEIVINYHNPDKTPIIVQSAKLQLRKKATSVTFDLELIGVLEPSTGKITFTAIPSETRALLTSTKNIYVYDIEVTISANEIKTIADGKITVTSDITR